MVRKIILGVGVLLGCLLTDARASSESVLQIAARAIAGMNRATIAYDYSITLVERKGRLVVDRVNGSMWKSNDFYKDSNSLFINLRDDLYAMQIKKSAKTIYLKSIRNLERKQSLPHARDLSPAFDLSHVKPENIVSSKAIKQGDGTTIVAFDFKGIGIDRVEACLTATGAISRLVLSTPEASRAASGLERVLIMENIRFGVPESEIQSRRYVSGKGKTIKPSAQFAGYKIVSLI